MLVNKTVFVIGAGASSEVGLPIGSQLKVLISQMLVDATSAPDHINTYRQQFTNALQLYGSRTGTTTSDARGQIISALPMAISIDNYLHTHRYNEKLVFVGKAAIAFCILQAERNSQLFITENYQFNSQYLKNTWYNALSQMLFEDVIVEDVESVFNNVSFIVFNYDRCLEYYLHNALKIYFNVTDSYASYLIDKKLIRFHPYGHLGSLWNTVSQNEVKYGTAFVNDLVSFIEGIRTFTEGNTDPNLSISIKEELEGASNIVFLGCAYHKLNESSNLR